MTEPGTPARETLERRPPLPTRRGERPQVHQGMPHSQIDVEPVAAVNLELFRRAFALPGVSNEATVVSVPGARALWLDESIPLARAEAVMAGREFAHVHPDGSLHLSLPPERAREAVATGWAELHPLARRSGNESLVLLYTPRDFEELEVVMDLITDAWSYVTGRPRPTPRLD